MRRSTLIWRNLRRHQTHSIFASIGIIVGVALLLFFGALSEGVQRHVVSKIVPERQIEVVPRAVQLGAFQRQGGLFGGSSSGLTDYTVADLRALPGVTGVYPRLQIGFPALARGGDALLGENMVAELLVDGVPSELVDTKFSRANAGDLAFVDWDAISTCGGDDTCAPGSTCSQGKCVPRACVPSDEIWWAPNRVEASRAVAVSRTLLQGNPRLVVREIEGPRFAVAIEDGPSAQLLREELPEQGIAGEIPRETGCGEGPAYCQVATRTCQMPVPVLASPTMLELYNGNLQSMLAGASGGTKPPRVTEDALIGMTFDATLGRGMLGTSQGVRSGRVSTRDVRLQVVGFSSIAMPIGATLPLGYVSRWNAEFGDQELVGSWSSILVEVDSPKALNPLVDVVENTMGLSIHDRYETARRVAGMVTIVMWVFAGLGLLMIVVASVNIAHTFMMLATERRREIGILRSLGATRTDITTLFLAESSMIGAFGWVVAIVLSFALAAFVDMALARWIQDFPWKPESLFAFPGWLIGASFIVAILCATLGAWVPAYRAARMDPADALREREG